MLMILQTGATHNAVKENGHSNDCELSQSREVSLVQSLIMARLFFSCSWLSGRPSLRECLMGNFLGFICEG